MENKDLEDTMSFKLLILIKNAGAAGITHTQLLQATRYKTNDVARLVKPYEDEFRVVSRQVRKSEFGLGRQPRRYWHKDFAPQEVLTALAPSATPTLEPGTIPPKGGTCRQCGGAIPSRGPGRLPDYCSPACRNLAMEGGVTIGRFFSGVKDPHTFAQMAVLLVTMDLLRRGYHVGSDLLSYNGGLIVHDGTNFIFLPVIPLSDAGYLPPADMHEHMAIVYRDGRITYSGRDPLVFGEADSEVEKVGIETEVATSKDSEGACNNERDE